MLRTPLTVCGALFYLVLIAPTLAVGADKPGKPVVLGELRTLPSAILQEDRPLLIHLPPGYGQGEARYPVMVLLDGAEHFNHVASLVDFLAAQNRIPWLIVVGVVNTDRTRNFSPTHLADGPANATSGGAGNFLRFLEAELLPHLANEFRTQPYRILAGHCLTGLFAVQVLLERPDLFQAYLPVSPYLGWDNRVVLKDVGSRLKKLTDPRTFVFVAYGDASEKIYAIDTDVQRFEQILRRQAPADLAWKVVHFAEEDHDSIVHPAIHRGLRALFADWRVDPGAPLEAIEKHFETLSARFGYPITAPEAELNRMGYQALAQKDLERALVLFRLNVKHHPRSANVYDSLGEALEQQEQFALAAENYRRAIEILAQAPQANPRVMEVYRAHLARAQKRIGKGS